MGVCLGFGFEAGVWSWVGVWSLGGRLEAEVGYVVSLWDMLTDSGLVFDLWHCFNSLVILLLQILTLSL